MNKSLTMGVILTLLSLWAACGKSSPTTPTMPTPRTTPTLQSVTVSSANAKFKIGDNETFAATANMTDGTKGTITTGAWSTDNMSVATVDSHGLVTIVGPGSVNIVLTYNGMTGAKGIQGFPVCEGSWAGTYRIDSCSATGDFLTEGFCEFFSVGEILPIGLDLYQAGDSLSGTAYHGGVHWAVSGQITKNGEVALSGKYTGSLLVIDATYAMQLANWLNWTNGTLHQRWTESDMTGYGEFGCSIVELNWQSPGLGPLNAVATKTPFMKNPTLKEMIRALGLR